MSRTSLFRRLFGSARRSESKPARRTRLAVEAMEDRAVPALITVNTLVDENNGIGDGSSVSLREAIIQANALAGDDTISLPTGTYHLTLTGAGEEAAATGDLDISANGKLTIQGAGAATTIIDAAGLGDRVFHVLASANLDISGVSILNGNESSGGGIYNAGTLTVSQCTLSGNFAPEGGGIYNAGTLAVSQSTLSGDSAGYGGGISNLGTLTVSQSTLSGNVAVFGGGIHNEGMATVSQSTLSGNSASTGSDTSFGGGIDNLGTLTVSQCTLSANTAGSGGVGGIVNAGTLMLNNSIVANSTGPDIGNGGSITGSHNLIEDGSGGLSDTIIGDPLLGPLADNGGPTKTHALLAGSPAIDAGSNLLVPAGVNTDQRGAGRIGAVDIGAYEFVPTNRVVDITADEDDGNYAAGDLSLREAIKLANANPEADTIILPAGTYHLTLTGAGEDGAVTGDLDIAASGKLTIQGAGAAATIIDASGLGDRVFQVLPGANLDISGVSILNGYSANAGGGIENFLGMVKLTGCTLSGNSAYTNGGAISNDFGTVEVVNSTLSGNSVGASGGAIFNRGTLTVTDSTLSGNSGPQVGGAIRNVDGTVTITGCTLSGNSGGQGGGIFNENSMTLNNSIVANSPAGGDVSNYGTLTGSHNLIEDGSGAGLTGTIIGDPKLGPLGDYGGPTKTFALLPGSPAINAGSDALIPAGATTDQRGFARIAGAHVDIGAFEVQNGAPTLSAPVAATANEDVDLAFTDANKIRVGDPDGDTLKVTLSVGDGTLTLQTTGGQTVTGAVVSLSGSIADLNAALATLSYRGGLNYSGDDLLNITVGDDSLSTSGRVAIHVKSAAEQAADLQGKVDALYATGVLNKGQDTSLDAKLRIQDNLGDAGKVQAFLNQVAALFQAGILNQDQADGLSGPGRILLQSVSIR
jgi:CSLREA domain-containing protein